MKNPEVTVLMPVYNGAKYLNTAIDSILNQTYKDFEFLIINDGSTDNSEEIILSYKDERIRYIKNELNIKLIKTLNKGVNLARGKYIARMDCDDISFPTRLERQINYLHSHKDLDGVAGRVFDLLPHDIIKRSLRYLPLHKDAFRFTSLFEISFCHPCLTIRTDVLRKEKFLDNECALHIEDMELGSRLSLLGYNIEVIDDFLILYRKNISGICFTHREEQKIRSYELAKKNLKTVLNFDVDKEFYTFLTDKCGLNSYDKLCISLDRLNNLVNSYITKYQINDKNSLSDIKSWAYVREFSFIMSSLKEVNGFYNKIRVVFVLFLRLKCICNIGFLKSMNIWLRDWSGIFKEKQLSSSVIRK